MSLQRISLCCGLFFLFFAATAQEGFTLKVKIKDYDKYAPFLFYVDSNNESVIERTYTVEDGLMIFKGKVNEVAFASFGLRYKETTSATDANRGMPSPPRSLVLTNSVITLTADGADKVHTAIVDGGELNKEYDTALTKMIIYEREERAKTATSSAPANQMNAMMDVPARMRFIDENPTSIASVYYLSMLRTMLSLDVLKSAYTKLSSKYKHIPDAKAVSDLIANMEATSTGKMAIEIVKKDINGHPVTLNTLKGKYVLIDFWGSWCGPCRASHPHLKEIYKKYKAEGLEILGVADEHGRTLEDNKRTWKKAVQEDGMTWLQVLNNEDQEVFDAVKAYGVTVFPTKVLLDKDGKVVARYAGESHALDLKLQEIFVK